MADALVEAARYALLTFLCVPGWPVVIVLWRARGSLDRRVPALDRALAHEQENGALEGRGGRRKRKRPKNRHRANLRMMR